MFSKQVIDSDAFSDMPLTAQALYFHLAMRADDDGFVNSPKRIQRGIGASNDDLKLLAMKGFIIPFETGIVVITHWKVHNYIRKDTYTETAYQDEKAALQLKDNKVYFLPSTDCQRAVDDSWTQNRLDKNRLDKNSIDICAEQLHSSTPETEEAPFIFLVLNDKSNFPVYQKQVNEWEELYPAVNVAQELRNMSGWLNSNPKKRKTKSGILRFINGWLSREQDSGGSKQADLNQNSAFKLSGDYESL